MSRRKKSAPVAPEPDPYPMTFETFRPFDGYDRRQYEDTEPSAFNGWVRIHRYRVTVERVVEPVEVLAERLRKLWRENDNWHHVDPLRKVARRLGVELNAEERGVDRKKRS